MIDIWYIRCDVADGIDLAEGAWEC